MDNGQRCKVLGGLVSLGVTSLVDILPTDVVTQCAAVLMSSMVLSVVQRRVRLE